ncbi:MAG: hypothetical protein MR503_09860 [Oscillospiraceae bacterium]|nr:hypothetical protein [Oscillospiraceae bacterium]
MDKNKKKKQGIIDTVRQVDEKERQKLEAEKEEELKVQEKEREEYGKTLAEEKVELLKLKQGVISESDKLDLKPDEKKHYTPWQKFKNFIYHNKWWLGISTFFVLIAAFLVYDTLTTTKPDIKFMLLCNDTELYYRIEDIGKYFDQFTDDYNDDDKNCADILYIPISENEDTNSMGLYESSLTKLSAEFQMGETMLVIADKNSAELIMPEETLVNLEELYPDNPNIKEYGFYLKDTDFAELIGYTDGNIPDDIYIGIRKVTQTLTSEKEMQEHYDQAIETLDKIIKELSK